MSISQSCFDIDRLVHGRDIGGVDCVRAFPLAWIGRAAAALAVGRLRVVGSERTLVQPTFQQQAAAA